MVMKSQREVRPIDPAWDISETMAHIAKALAGDGPALSIGQIATKEVGASIALVIPTSGSTGKSKEVALTAHALLSSARASHTYLGASLGEKWSLLLPLTHIAGINVLVRSLELGTIPLNLTHHEDEYPYADFTAVVSTQLYRALHGDNFLFHHLQSAKAVLVGGGALSEELRAEAVHNGINIVETYGMTETSGGCVYNGIPLDGVEIEIDEHGVIRIAGPVLATTYLNEPELWQESFLDGWFITSDLGSTISGKVFVHGRIDDIAITGGEKVSLSAIEDVLQQKYESTDFVAFFIKDEQWGHAIYLATSGASPDDGQIRESLERSLGVAAKPKGIIRLDVIPRTALGKPDRQKLISLVNHE